MMQYRIFLKVFILVLFSFLSAICFVNALYLTSVMFIILVIILAFAIYNDQQKVIKRMEQMISSIHYGDLNIAFHSTAKGAEGNLVRAMNEAMTTFRNRLYNFVKVETENEAWQKLVRVLTHEIMNSIAPIVSLAETITDRANQNERNEEDYQTMLQSMRSIHRRSRGLLDFVENYRKITRIPEPVIGPVPVHELFRSIEHLFSDKKHVIQYKMVPPDLIIYADRTLLEQVLINLLKNAVEACADLPKGDIQVMAYRKEGMAVISISDNGSGIVPEAVDKVFVPFYSTKPGGSGIGLSLCRQIINKHSGSISVFSEAETGTLFTITLPLKQVM